MVLQVEVLVQPHSFSYQITVTVGMDVIDAVVEEEVLFGSLGGGGTVPESER